MVVISYAGKEANAKIVYYGPGLGGKTTNLEFIYDSVPASSRGKMVSMKTQTDRTLFFDFLPLDLGELGGFKTRFLLYTVPGQVFYNATRKLVLRGCDAIGFIADSQVGKMDENKESLANLEENLAEYDLKLEDIPLVIQYNKRDLPNVYTIEDLNRELNPRNVPYFEAVATEGVGVFETFRGLSKLLLEKLSEEIGHRMLAGRSLGRRVEVEKTIETFGAKPAAETEIVREPERVQAEPVQQAERVGAEAVREPERVEAEPVRELERLEAEAVREPERVEAEPVRQLDRVEAEAVREPERVEAEPVRVPETVEAQSVRGTERVEPATIELSSPGLPESSDVDLEELEILPSEEIVAASFQEVRQEATQAAAVKETPEAGTRSEPEPTITREHEVLQGFFGEAIDSAPLEKEILREEIILSREPEPASVSEATSREQVKDKVKETGSQREERAGKQPDELKAEHVYAGEQPAEQVCEPMTASEQTPGQLQERPCEAERSGQEVCEQMAQSEQAARQVCEEPGAGARAAETEKPEGYAVASDKEEERLEAYAVAGDAEKEWPEEYAIGSDEAGEASGEESFFRQMIRRNNIGLFGEHKEEVEEHAESSDSSEQVYPEEIGLEQVIPERIDVEQVGPEQAGSEQAVPEQMDREQASTDVKSLEQVIRIPASMLRSDREKEIVITLRLKLKADAEDKEAGADEFLLEGISR